MSFSSDSIATVASDFHGNPIKGTNAKQPSRRGRPKVSKPAETATPKLANSALTEINAWLSDRTEQDAAEYRRLVYRLADGDDLTLEEKQSLRDIMLRQSRDVKSVDQDVETVRWVRLQQQTDHAAIGREHRDKAIAATTELRAVEARRLELQQQIAVANSGSMNAALVRGEINQRIAANPHLFAPTST